jgi:hypothetical protein
MSTETVHSRKRQLNLYQAARGQITYGGNPNVVEVSPKVAVKCSFLVLYIREVHGSDLSPETRNTD